MQCNSSVTDGGKDQRELTTKIAHEVAQAKDVDLLDLTPVQSVIDTDALNALYTHPTNDVEVTFEYEGYRVTVRSDGTIELSNPT